MRHRILDLTDSAWEARRIRQRSVDDIDAVVLHQMGFSRGNSPGRYLRVASHFIILPDGTIGQLHDYTDYLFSSNGLNSRSVAVEFAGNFPSDRGRWWRPEEMGRHRITEPQVSAGRFLIEHLRDEIGITYVFGHRQAKASKSNCPGPDVWYNVGQWALARGMSDGGVGFTVGDGRPIPHSWRNHNFMVFTVEEVYGA